MRVAVTLLEEFRLYCGQEDGSEWLPESRLIARIKGQPEPPTPAMMLGSAYHAVLEDPERWREPKEGGYAPKVWDGAAWQTIFIPDDAVRPALEKFDRRGVFEVKTTKMYGDVEVVAKVDQLVGLDIIETKTKLSTFSFDNYWQSCQWRFYLDSFAASSIEYRVFLLNEDANGRISYRDCEIFNLFPYRSLHIDCLELVQRFVSYAQERGLEQYLMPRGDKEKQPA